MTLKMVLSFSPVSHDFGDMQEGQTDSATFEIWSSGSGTLEYRLKPCCEWVIVTPRDRASAGEHDIITVNVDTTGLSIGHYHCDIMIDSNGGSGNFAVDLDVISGGSEVLDQEQTQYGRDFMIYSDDWGVQSFKPTLATLTKIELYIGKTGSLSSDLVVSIRDSLTRSDLTSISKSASEVPSSPGWIEFGFSDISVTPGDTYYIVVRTSSGSSFDYYIWGTGYNTPYDDGSLWNSRSS